MRIVVSGVRSSCETSDTKRSLHAREVLRAGRIWRLRLVAIVVERARQAPVVSRRAPACVPSRRPAAKSSAMRAAIRTGITTCRVTSHAMTPSSRTSASPVTHDRARDERERGLLLLQREQVVDLVAADAGDVQRRADDEAGQRPAVGVVDGRVGPRLLLAAGDHRAQRRRHARLVDKVEAALGDRRGVVLARRAEQQDVVEPGRACPRRERDHDLVDQLRRGVALHVVRRVDQARRLREPGRRLDQRAVALGVEQPGGDAVEQHRAEQRDHDERERERRPATMRTRSERRHAPRTMW